MIDRASLPHDEDDVRREGPRNGDADRTLEAARIADVARCDCVREGLGRSDDEAPIFRQSGLGIERPERQARAGRGVQLCARDAIVGFHQPRTGRDEIDERARLCEHFQHLAGRGCHEEVEPRRHLLALEEGCRREHVAERRARISAEDHLVDGLAVGSVERKRLQRSNERSERSGKALDPAVRNGNALAQSGRT